MRAKGALALVAAACSREPAPAPAPLATSAATAPAAEDAAAPPETAQARFVVDPGVPRWLRDLVTGDVARFFAFYEARLGPLTAPKPTVHLSFGTREHGRSIGGEARPGNLVSIQLELEPDAAGGPDAAARLALEALVAHELAHLWTDPPAGPWLGVRWMREGLPEAFALRALRGTGAMSDASYRAALSESASECAMWLTKSAVSLSAPPPGYLRAAYVCGSTAALVEDAVRTGDAGSWGLLAAWREWRDRSDGGVDSGAFFDPRAADPAARRAGMIATLMTATQLDANPAIIRGALKRVGLDAAERTGSPFPDDYEQHASIPAALALLPPACAAALTFDGDSEVLPRVASDGACPGLARNDRIETLAGVPLGAMGATAWDAGYASCQSRHAVDVGVRGTTLTVPCDPAARPRPAYFDVQGAP